MAKKPEIVRRGDVTQVGDNVRIEPVLGTDKFKVLRLADEPDAKWQPEPTLYESEEAAMAAAVGT